MRVRPDIHQQGAKPDSNSALVKLNPKGRHQRPPLIFAIDAGNFPLLTPDDLATELTGTIHRNSDKYSPLILAEMFMALFGVGNTPGSRTIYAEAMRFAARFDTTFNPNQADIKALTRYASSDLATHHLIDLGLIPLGRDIDGLRRPMNYGVLRKADSANLPTTPWLEFVSAPRRVDSRRLLMGSKNDVSLVLADYRTAAQPRPYGDLLPSIPSLETEFTPSGLGLAISLYFDPILLTGPHQLMQHQAELTRTCLTATARVADVRYNEAAQIAFHHQLLANIFASGRSLLTPLTDALNNNELASAVTTAVIASHALPFCDRLSRVLNGLARQSQPQKAFT